MVRLRPAVRPVRRRRRGRSLHGVLPPRTSEAVKALEALEFRDEPFVCVDGPDNRCVGCFQQDDPSLPELAV